MTTEQGPTLVVSRAFLDGFRQKAQGLVLAAHSDTARDFARGQLAAADAIIRHGTTVNMDHSKVAGLAQALANVSEVAWQDRERDQERYYSEADFGADWTPSGETA